jgi:hypothetical protein
VKTTVTISTRGVERKCSAMRALAASREALPAMIDAARRAAPEDTGPSTTVSCRTG